MTVNSQGQVKTTARCTICVSRHTSYSLLTVSLPTVLAKLASSTVSVLADPLAYALTFVNADGRVMMFLCFNNRASKQYHESWLRLSIWTNGGVCSSRYRRSVSGWMFSWSRNVTKRYLGLFINITQCRRCELAKTVNSARHGERPAWRSLLTSGNLRRRTVTFL